jgi:Cu-Zn family superoxide dismutase
MVLGVASSRAADLSVTLEPASGSSVRGQLQLADAARGVRITGEVTGLAPGQHGFHVHEVGDCSAKDATSAGEHFNPSGKQHGGLRSAERHIGDLGNIDANASGIAMVDVTGTGLSIDSARVDSLRGRALVVHAQRDDEKSSPAGNSGSRVACGVIPK